MSDGKHIATNDCRPRDVVMCGGCGRSWCDRCDPAPSALCHWCNGRGYSTAAINAVGDPGRWEAEMVEQARRAARAAIAQATGEGE